MVKWRWFAPFRAALTGAALLSIGAVPVAAGVEALDASGVTSTTPELAAQLSNDHEWTAAEMSAALPYPVLETADSASQPTTAGASGQPGIADGRAPRGARSLSSRGAAASGSAGRAAAEPSSYTTYPAPYDRYVYPGDLTAFPVYPIGKLFFTQNGRNYVCSASVVGLNEIWTAGHCTHAGNNQPTGWSTNVQFCPAYDIDNGGVDPGTGCWLGDGAMSVATDYYVSGSFNRDLGAIHLRPTGTVVADNIGNVTGWLGFAWNQPRDVHYSEFGYPAAAPFNGGKLQMVTAEFAFMESIGVGPASQSTGSDLTGGSSGGPWVWKLNRGDYVNGHNDWRFTARPEEMNSPYFDDLANNVRLAQNT